MIIYVAGPYTGPSIAEIDINVAIAQAAGIEIMKRGHVALVPHTMTHHWDVGTGLTYEQFIAATMALLERCDAICMCGGWGQSNGALGELKRARELGLHVYYNHEAVPEAKQ